MKHFMFRIIDDDFEACGEEFLVGAESKEEAVRIATDLFSIVKYLGAVSEFEAEMSGLDEY